MSHQFICDVCGVVRTEIEGAGDWFSVGINDYGPPIKRSRKLHIYAWPLGCRSQQDDMLKHSCSKSHLLEIVKAWASPEEQK